MAAVMKYRDPATGLYVPVVAGMGMTQAEGDARYLTQGRNRVMNGDFSVNQRVHGETLITNTYTFSHDRWYGASGSMTGTGQAYVTTRGITLGALPEGATTCIMLSAYNTAGTSTSHNVYMAHRIEGVGTLSGKLVTLSFWASTLQGTPMNLGILALQNFGSGGSATVVTTAGVVSVAPGPWQRYYVTFTMPSMASKTRGANSFVELQFYNSAGSAYFSAVGAQHNNMLMWGVQLEEGPVATAYEHRSYGDTLRDCQRYFVRRASEVANGRYGFALCSGTATRAFLVLSNPPTLRTAPTVAWGGGFTLDSFGAGGGPPVTNILASSSGNSWNGVLLVDTAVAMVPGSMYLMKTSDSMSAYIDLNAEL